MDFFADTHWDNGHAYPLADGQHAGLDQGLADGERLSPRHHQAATQPPHADLSDFATHHASEDYTHYSEGLPRDASPEQYHSLLMSDQFLSPELSLHTPLLSPHTLAPLPAAAPQDFKMPPPAATSAPAPLPSRRSSLGKVVKQSPQTRWRSSSLPDDEFRLGDAALDEPVSAATIMNLAPRPQEDLDERLRSAIAATTASSQSSSRRTSSVSSSTRVTPRIRPRIGSSADPSPLLAPSNPGSAAGPGDEDVDQVFLKSNYRNLMEGTHKHLNFPAADRLTTELRAKKTVHKLAEQERRNRMNVAIAELSGVMGAQSDGSGASKAATVERATQHIHKLNSRISDLEQRLAQLEGRDDGVASKPSPKKSPAP